MFGADAACLFLLKCIRWFWRRLGYVPTVCIAYDHKQTGFLNDLGLTDYLIPLKDVNSETIVSKVGKVIDRKRKKSLRC